MLEVLHGVKRVRSGIPFFQLEEMMHILSTSLFLGFSCVSVTRD